MNRYRARGLVVMIVACQVIDPGSIPGERTVFALHCWLFFLFFFRGVCRAVVSLPKKEPTPVKYSTSTTLTPRLERQKIVENQGIDPCASRMLSVRSTI